VVADLQGPKIRLGRFAQGPVLWRAGDRVTITAEDTPGTAQRVSTTYPRLADDVSVGDGLLVDDGTISLAVVAVRGPDVVCEVMAGGPVSDHKGLSLPGVAVSEPALSGRDADDLRFALGLGVDLVALSFVRSAADVGPVRAVLAEAGSAVPVLAKLEKPEAVAELDAVLGAFDGIMVARGDLGVEMPLERVPLVQKRAVQACRETAKPAIVATQMLESMLASPRPTRAEASDIANAVFDGADAIMLSGETAIGEYPILAAEAAARICRLCEQRGSDHLAAGAPLSGETDAGALAYAAVALAAAETDIVGIACYTRTGSTARILSSLRPRVPIFAFSPDPSVVARLALVYGVVGRTCVAETGTADRLGLMAWLLSESRSVPAGAAVVLVASTAAAGSGPNLLEVHRVPS
jgi:pyruvate kinase